MKSYRLKRNRMSWMKNLMMKSCVNVIIPASSTSVIASRSRSWSRSSFLLSWWLNCEAKSLNLLIIHLFSSIFCIVIVLKFLRLLWKYNETVRAFILDTVDLSVRFKPFFEIFLGYRFSIALHIHFWIPATWWHLFQYKKCNLRWWLSWIRRQCWWNNFGLVML